MICPHCEHELLRKERPGNRCAYCRRVYALDPKTNALKLSDLRVRRAMAALSADGRLAVAPGQLWYALSRRSLRTSGLGAVWNPLTGVLGFGLLLAGVVIPFVPAVVAGGILSLVSVSLVVARSTGVGRGVPAVDRDAFRSRVLAPWLRVYGELPTGMVDDPVREWKPQSVRPARRKTVAPAPPRDAGAPGVLLCPDPSIIAFLAAEGVADDYGLALVRTLDEAAALAPRGPVIVLHDADAHGALLARRVREALPRVRVVDAGLPVRKVRGLAHAVPVRDRWRRPDAAARRELAALGAFTEAELKWLGRGWGFPLVGLPPARLLDAVTRCAARATGRPDTARAGAAELGFLTWPSPGPAEGGGE
ncbi:hypothetical protein [Streptomyces sp. NBC_00102]|uniref:hypothetical protein n=1 Tax=Streptomyces sp. NBC_00102 TaxID=2975652 RepID=UPI00224CA0DF|nr:hypothetical protein [Streptomyces sp. NBC_00102]MCX5401863.1 hypothetical protein [Streptomyces sp. NBC_00102]